MSTATRTRIPHSGGPAPSGNGAPPMGPPARKPFRMASSRRRITWMFVVFAIVVSLFAARLVELQLLKGGELAGETLGKRLVTQDIPAVRGEITDINGVPLATSIEVRHITADQTLVEDPQETAAVLGPIIGMDPAVLVPELTGERRFIYLKKNTPPQIWRDIQAWRAAEDNDGKVLQGIFSERLTIRDYPNKELGANLTGFTNAEGDGACCLESALNDVLNGEPGSVSYEEAPGGNEIPASDVQKVAPRPGTDVRLTIDADLQAIAQRAITKQAKASNSDFGMVVALHVPTGRILAMATGPSFDPENPDKVEPGDWNNKPVTWAMEPGSTAKLMTIAAVLDQGALKPKSSVVVPGTLLRGGKAFEDSHAHGTLQLTLAGVLAQSSNIGTILAAEEIGGDRLYEYLRNFGVGSPTGLSFPGEQSGYLLDPADWSETTFPTLAFGQGMSMTAIQIASMVASIGNDGVYTSPKLIDSYVGADGTVQQTAPGEQHRVLKESTAKKMQKLMQLVLQEGGTAKNAAVPGYLVGGKTGTAQRYDEECGCYSGYTASFVGMAPANDPEIVVGAWLDNPRGSYYGGAVAGPVVQQVLTAALASQGVPPTGDKPFKFPLTTDGSSLG